jgi:hypothetical protein
MSLIGSFNVDPGLKDNARVADALFQMMIATIEIDIARINITKRADLSKLAFHAVLERVADAYEMSLKAKQAVGRLLTGIYKIRTSIANGIEIQKFSLEMDPDQTEAEPTTYVTECNLNGLKTQINDFKECAVGTLKELQENSTQLLQDISGSGALTQKIHEIEVMKKKIDAQFEVVRNARDVLSVIEKVESLQTAELEIKRKYIESEVSLQSLLHTELRNLVDAQALLKQKKVLAPPSKSEQKSGWGVFSRTTTQTVSTREDLKESEQLNEREKEEKEERTNAIVANIEAFKKELGKIQGNLRTI